MQSRLFLLPGLVIPVVFFSAVVILASLRHCPATGWMLAALALGQDETIPDGFRADRYLLGRFQTTHP